MNKVIKHRAVFDYAGYKKGTLVDTKPVDAPENLFVPVLVDVEPEKPVSTKRPSTTSPQPEGA